MTREEAIRLIGWLKCTTNREDDLEAIDMAIEALQAEPTKAVPPSLADVYKWERDIALSQLEEYGIGFAEKKRDDLVSVVRCKDCIHWDTDSHCYYYRRAEDFCSWGERREE